jgi:N-methylhydantoinase A
MVEENMANAARVHAVERGAELEGRTLIAFGGGAPLHAARLAEKLGITDVLIPASAGVGSAVGFLRAPIAFELVRSRFVRLGGFDAAGINDMFTEMEREATDVVRLGAAPQATITISRSADMRYAGQGHEILVDLPNGPFTAASVDELKKRFETGYRALFNRVVPAIDVEVTGWTLRAEAPAPGRAADLPDAGANEEAAPTPVGTRQLFDPVHRGFRSVPVYHRSTLKPGNVVQGPAVIAEDETTTIVSSGFLAVLDHSGAIRLTAKARTGARALQEVTQ